jgi:hypothetical protein
MLMFAARLAAAATVTVLAAGAAPHPLAHQETLALTVAPTDQQAGTTYLETDTASRDGQPIGLDVLTCPGAAQAGVTIAHCTIDFGLESGTLHASITQDTTTGMFTGAITGGTGRYQRATGRVYGQGTDTGASLNLTLSGTP